MLLAQLQLPVVIMNSALPVQILNKIIQLESVIPANATRKVHAAMLSKLAIQTWVFVLQSPALMKMSIQNVKQKFALMASVQNVVLMKKLALAHLTIGVKTQVPESVN